VNEIPLALTLSPKGEGEAKAQLNLSEFGNKFITRILNSSNSTCLKTKPVQISFLDANFPRNSLAPLGERGNRDKSSLTDVRGRISGGPHLSSKEGA